jgi:hypothetical protein
MESQRDLPQNKTSRDLAAWCRMRWDMEDSQQKMLAKSVSLSRFIKITSLARTKDFPELRAAKKLLSDTFKLANPQKSTQTATGFSDYFLQYCLSQHN